MNLKQYVIFALCALGVCSAAVAGDWPQLEKRLSTWDGVKEVQLPADVDPLEDPFLPRWWSCSCVKALPCGQRMRMVTPAA